MVVAPQVGGAGQGRGRTPRRGADVERGGGGPLAKHDAAGVCSAWALSGTVTVAKIPAMKRSSSAVRRTHTPAGARTALRTASRTRAHLHDGHERVVAGTAVVRCRSVWPSSSLRRAQLLARQGKLAAHRHVYVVHEFIVLLLLLLLLGPGGP